MLTRRTAARQPGMIAMTRFSLFAAAAFAAALLSAPALAQDTRTWTDDAGRTVDIPVDPQRIVSLHDVFITVPLIELGVLPVASLGRPAADGSYYIRSARMLTGVDFDNSGIAFLGTVGSADAEAILAFDPDLIIASTNETNIEQLAGIAPTIQFDYTRPDKLEIYELVADIAGATDQLAFLNARYEEQLAQLRAFADPTNTSVNVIGAGDGEIIVYYRWGSIGRLLDDAGFLPPPALADVPLGTNTSRSAELIGDMDADLVLLTYRAEAGETPESAVAALDAVFPGFCDHLQACRTGNMIAVPRDETFGTSYGALGILAYTLIALSAGSDVAALAGR